MKLKKELICMGLGMGALLAYQKYGVPMMKKAEKAVDRTIEKMDNKVNQMM